MCSECEHCGAPVKMNEDGFLCYDDPHSEAQPVDDEQYCDDSHRGLYHKFDVKRTDGRDAPGHKHHDCEYFVLDMTHDPHALKALEAYAESCCDDYPSLAIDLRKKIAELRLEQAIDHDGSGIMGD